MDSRESCTWEYFSPFVVVVLPGDRPLGFSEVDDDFRNLTPGRTSLSLTRFRLRALMAHCDSAAEDSGPVAGSDGFSVPVAVKFREALSASSCCRRNRFNCSAVSFLTASSLARVDSRTESRNSTSSSSRLRNWFLRRIDSSKASCFAARSSEENLICQQMYWIDLQSRCISMLKRGEVTFVVLQNLEKRLPTLLPPFFLFPAAVGLDLLLSFQPLIIPFDWLVGGAPRDEARRHPAKTGSWFEKSPCVRSGAVGCRASTGRVVAR